MSHIYTLHDVDPGDLRLTRREAQMFAAMLAKRAEYIERGRGQHAHGMGVAICMAWRVLLEDGVDVDVTVPGDL